MRIPSSKVAAAPKRPIRLVIALPIGLGLVASLIIASSVVFSQHDPALWGWVSYGLGGCDTPTDTETRVMVTSSTGQVVYTQLQAPETVDLGFGITECDYPFEIQDPIPGDTLTFRVPGCSAKYPHGTVMSDADMRVPLGRQVDIDC